MSASAISSSISGLPHLNGVTYEAPRMWGRLIFYVVIVSAVVHAFWGLITGIKVLLRGDGIHAILIPVIYFAVGGGYGFVLAAAPAGGLVLCHSTLDAGMTDLEMIIYSFVLCTLIAFFSSGTPLVRATNNNNNAKASFSASRLHHNNHIKSTTMTSSSSHTYKNVCLGLSLLVLLCIAVGVTGSLHGLAPPNSSPVHSTVAPTSVTEYFLTSKIAFAVLILLSSMLGVLAPSLLLILWGRDRVRKARRASSPLDSDTTTMMGSSGGEATAGSSDSPLAGVGSLLSLSNCFSAGLLVGMGALHFIPEGFEGAAEILPSKWVGTHEHHHEGDEGQHTHHFHSPGWMAYIGGTAESATLFFLLIGIGVPVLIDRAVNWLTAAPACGDHSHGGTFLDALDKKEGGGGKPDDVAHHNNNNTHGTTTADASSNKPRSAATTLILLAALLSFHGTTEGVVIGSTLETASITTLGTFIITNPLLSLMLPMTLHKFFDALVLGIPVAEETRRRLEEAMRDGSSHVSMWGTCISILRKKTVLISTISTPVVLLGTTIMTYSVAVGKEGGGNHHTHPPTPPGATAADEGGSNNLQVLSFASKAVGAGTFLYIGIAEIIVTEMKGVFAQLRGSGVGVVQGVLRHGGSILPSIAPKLASIGAGMLVVVVMGWVFPHQHSS